MHENMSVLHNCRTETMRKSSIRKASQYLSSNINEAIAIQITTLLSLIFPRSHRSTHEDTVIYLKPQHTILLAKQQNEALLIR